MEVGAEGVVLPDIAPVPFRCAGGNRGPGAVDQQQFGRAGESRSVLEVAVRSSDGTGVAGRADSGAHPGVLLGETGQEAEALDLRFDGTAGQYQGLVERADDSPGGDAVGGHSGTGRNGQREDGRHDEPDPGPLRPRHRTIIA